ncbi:sulfite exporter TauE/SafE family protein [Neorhodopirellula lusitana]|uniref:sulfite exporter TauE/SafE family protein n=1 Tax=Neorhodopirellula lusitana TaxID=445327 RepID=UPI00384D3786
MWILISAVVTASLLGSMHCVGMCGPLAIFASGAGEKAPRRQVVLSTSLYHLGRLLTYTLAGLIAGTLGSLVDVGGQTLGFQLAAARLVGTVMIAIGLWKLVSMWLPRSAATSGPTPSRIGGLLVKLRPIVFGLPPSGRAFATGLLTTLLPCGWLYLFALVAAGTGNPVSGGITMAAFWVGTVPALTALIAGTQTLSHKFVQVVPTAAALLLIVTGGITASGRGFAEISSLSEIAPPVSISTEPAPEDSTPVCCCDPNATQCNCPPPSIQQQINALTKTPLPCCAGHVNAETSVAEDATGAAEPAEESLQP